jgi:transcriptional regulator with GAF, ATPase, and Fis domain
MKRRALLNSMSESQGAAVASGEISALKDLSFALSSVLESLGVLEAYQIIKRPGRTQGINFYDEVSRFEINLILFALKQTGWCQRRAATLLGLKTTTLNYKIKVYNIDCKNPFARETVGASPSLK